MSVGGDADLPEHGFDFWREMLAQQVMPVLVRTRDAAAFTGTMRPAGVGPVRTLLTVNRSIDVQRTPALIRRSDPEAFLLVLNYRGHQAMSQNRQTAPLDPGDVVLLHSSRPFHSISDPRVVRQVGSTVLLEPSLLPMPVDRLTPLLGARLPGHDPVVALVSRYVLALGSQAHRLSESDGVRLAGVTADLITLMLSRRLDLDRGLPPDTRARAMLARVQAYALARLGDPALSPELIAAAHHLSLRTLQRLFQANELTVAEWIRQTRLERCRRDLTDPEYDDRGVSDIARRWGFADPAHFSRTFKHRYGQSPLAYREQNRG